MVSLLNLQPRELLHGDSEGDGMLPLPALGEEVLHPGLLLELNSSDTAVHLKVPGRDVGGILAQLGRVLEAHGLG